MPRRFREKHDPVDFPVLIQMINDAGWSFEEIGEAVGMHRKSVYNLATERAKHNEEWDRAIKFLDLFVRLYGIHKLPTISKTFEE